MMVGCSTLLRAESNRSRSDLYQTGVVANLSSLAYCNNSAKTRFRRVSAEVAQLKSLEKQNL
jgi:hypothetical protein